MTPFIWSNLRRNPSMNSANPSGSHHKVLIVGGGSAGLTMAARLRRGGLPDVAVLEPSARHYYQPLWTLVGGGRAPQRASVRPQATVMPKGVTWIQGAAAAVDPAAQQVTTESGQVLGYDYLVMAPGLQLDFDRVPGLTQTLGQRGVASNYRYDLAPRTWEFIRGLRSGTALFTMPAGPVPCPPAPPARPRPRGPGGPPGPCAAAPRCSPCRPARSSARGPRRRSRTWRPTGGGARASSTASGSSSCCRPRPCSASPTGRRCSPASRRTTASRCAWNPRSSKSTGTPGGR